MRSCVFVGKGAEIGYGAEPIITVADNIEFGSTGLSLLAGRNGAGKTTFMRYLCGCQAVRPSGSYRSAYLPEDLDFAREVSGEGVISALIWSDQVRQWVLNEARNVELPTGKAFGTLSKGNKQKLRTLVVLALARQNDAHLVCLDEAMSGIDYAIRRMFWAIIANEATARHVLLSLHPDRILSKSDQLIVVKHGKVRRVDISQDDVTWEYVETALEA